MNNENIPIERCEGVTLYGKKINNQGKLGQYTVYSDKHGTSGPYTTYKEAENRFKALSKPVRSSNPENN